MNKLLEFNLSPGSILGQRFAGHVFNGLVSEKFIQNDFIPKEKVKCDKKIIMCDFKVSVRVIEFEEKFALFIKLSFDMKWG